MSENVKQWNLAGMEPQYMGEGPNGKAMYCDPFPRREVVAAEDYDALLAERDALREAGERLADWLHPASPTAQAALAAWRAATGGGGGRDRSITAARAGGAPERSRPRQRGGGG